MCNGVLHDIGSGFAYTFTHDVFHWDMAPWAPYSNFGFPDGYHTPSLKSAPTPTDLKLPNGYAKDPLMPPYDAVATIEQAYSQISGADPNAGVSPAWSNVSKSIADTAENLQNDLNKLLASSDLWLGAAANAFHHSIREALPILGTLSAITQALSVLSQGFSDNITTTKNDIVTSYGNYQYDLVYYPEMQSTIKTQYDGYAQAVMTTYNQNVQNVANGYPSMVTAPTPHVGGTTGVHTPGGNSPVITQPGGSPVITGPGGSPAITGLSPSGSGAQTPSPTQSSGTPATMPTSAAASPAASSAMDPSSLANTASQAAQGLASPLQQSLGQLASTAGQGAKPPLGGPGGAASKLPPGKLADSLKPGAGGGKVGGGAGARGPVARPAGAPSSSGGMAGRTVAAGSRAGLSAVPGAAGAGAPAAGAPGRGQHGGAQGGAHQPNKVLRRKKNGEEIIGDAQAVVPVLGEPAHPEAAKPDAT